MAGSGVAGDARGALSLDPVERVGAWPALSARSGPGSPLHSTQAKDLCHAAPSAAGAGIPGWRRRVVCGLWQPGGSRKLA